MIDLKPIEDLKIIELVSFEENKQKLLSLMQSISPEIVLYESSDEMVMLEAFAYELTYRDTAFNQRIKSILPIFAKGDNLDDACKTFYATTRLAGEDDNAFLQRSQYSMGQAVTTGAYLPYVFHTKSVDVRITQVLPYRKEDGNITVVWHTLEEDVQELALIQNAIEAKLNDEGLRTLCATSQDIVQATLYPVSIEAHLTIDVGLSQPQIIENAKNALNSYFDNIKISEDISLSKITSILHIDGVKKVSITSPNTDVIVPKTHIASLASAVMTASEFVDA